MQFYIEDEYGTRHGPYNGSTPAKGDIVVVDGIEMTASGRLYDLDAGIVTVTCFDGYEKTKKQETPKAKSQSTSPEIKKLQEQLAHHQQQLGSLESKERNRAFKERK